MTKDLQLYHHVASTMTIHVQIYYHVVLNMVNDLWICHRVAGWTDRQTDGWSDRRRDGWMDGQTVRWLVRRSFGRTEGCTDVRWMNSWTVGQTEDRRVDRCTVAHTGRQSDRWLSLEW
jgi:hypothetical protein